MQRDEIGPPGAFASAEGDGAVLRAGRADKTGLVEGRAGASELLTFLASGLHGTNGDALLGLAAATGEASLAGGDPVRDGVGLPVGVPLERGVAGAVAGFKVRCDSGGEEGWGW